MEKPCENCPFNSSGPGLHLRKSLRPARWREITSGLLRGENFTCHKTTHETGDGSELMCAGAITYQGKRGVSSNLQRVMGRIDHMSKRGLAARTTERTEQGSTPSPRET